MDAVDDLAVDINPLYMDTTIGDKAIKAVFHTRTNLNAIRSVEGLEGTLISMINPSPFALLDPPPPPKNDHESKHIIYEVEYFVTKLVVQNYSIIISFYIVPELRYHAIIGNRVTSMLFFNLNHHPSIKYGTPMDTERPRKPRELDVQVGISHNAYKTFTKALKRTFSWNRNVNGDYYDRYDDRYYYRDDCSHRFNCSAYSFDPIRYPSISNIVLRFKDASYFSSLHLDRPLSRLDDNCPNKLNAILDDIMYPDDGDDGDPDRYDYVSIYMGNIIVYSDSFDDHIHHVKRVIRQLSENNLPLDKPRCRFAMKQLIVLGVLVSQSTRNAHPNKVSELVSDCTKYINNYNNARSSSFLQSILGKANAMRDFIPYYARLSLRIEEFLEQQRRNTSIQERHAESHQRNDDEIHLPTSSKLDLKRLRYAVSKPFTLYHLPKTTPAIVYIDVCDETLNAVIGYESYTNRFAKDENDTNDENGDVDEKSKIPQGCDADVYQYDYIRKRNPRYFYPVMFFSRVLRKHDEGDANDDDHHSDSNSDSDHDHDRDRDDQGEVNACTSLKILYALYHILQLWGEDGARLLSDDDRFIVRSNEDMVTKAHVRKHGNRMANDRFSYVMRYTFNLQVILERDNVLQHCLKCIEEGAEEDDDDNDNDYINKVE